ncbi:solute carrier family 25 member 36-like [Octopus vulgaris]|uniref:Solute carrier family 25 member 36-like n=2 Tax=Octopus TaxID=6643 RepID=A0AA36B1J9_OCTVU|nr:solute carrier family 25 member 36 isoform X1 [Octopus sinensis]CAI9724907.1 solute carrier family 25 member 36-like [Octopus vulgaris]
MASGDNAVHLLAGGIGGTVGAIITCPLEVLKTRLQSSVATFHHSSVYVPSPVSTHSLAPQTFVGLRSPGYNALELSQNLLTNRPRVSFGIYVCLRHIVETEGLKGLFKGLGPNLVGVAPSRALYFFAYANMKMTLNSVLAPDTPLVHIFSALAAGFTASTATNPIWFVKTRLQLDQKKDNSLKCRDCIKNIYQQSGVRGFYKGITASYFGMTETVIHFVIYEALKSRFLAYNNQKQSGSYTNNERKPSDFLYCMLSGAISKTCATCIAYPHEVARTRLRQEGLKYTSFFQTLFLVAREEGFLALYRGLGTQFVRQIPNTAIVMSTYELVVYKLSDR